MNKKYNYHVLETVARKVWFTLHYEEAVEASLLERKISFLFEAEGETQTTSPKEMEEVEAQAQAAVSELDKAIQTANEIFGQGSNTTEYLMSLGEEISQEPLLFPPDSDPKDAAKKIAQKVGTSAQIQKVVSSMNAAIKYFGEESNKLPLDKLDAEIQKLPDEAEVKTASGNTTGKELKEKWKSLPIGVVADVATYIQGADNVEVDWSGMPGRDEITKAAESSFKMEESSGWLAKVINFFGGGSKYDKTQFSEDILKVTIEKLLEKHAAVPAPNPAASQEASQTAADLQGELTALGQGDRGAMPAEPDSGPAPEGDPEEEPEPESTGNYKITPQDLKSIKASMETAKGKKKSQSKAMGSYLNQALDQEIFEEQMLYDEYQHAIEDLTYYKLMRMAGLPED